MNVVWEINGVTLIGIVAQCVVIAIFIVRASDRATAADKKAEKAIECASKCRDSVTILNGSFGAYRESVAQNYVTKTDLRDFEDRSEKALDKLGEQIQRAINNRGPVHK